VDRDATRKKRSPILFAAAAACSLASLVLSIFTEGRLVTRRAWGVVSDDDDVECGE
jgi:hypothetical protein